MRVGIVWCRHWGFFWGRHVRVQWGVLGVWALVLDRYI